MSILCAFGIHKYTLLDVECHIRKKKAKCVLDLTNPRGERLCVVTSLCSCCGKIKHNKSVCELGDWKE